MSVLSGVRVLDIGHLTSGPLAAWLLGSLGAEVVKIEPPTGDGGRTIVSPAEEGGPAGGYYFHSTNTDKESVAVDLKTERGQEAVMDLAAAADVLVENFRPGTMADLGLDYDTVSQRNPELIYCSVTGYGEDNVTAGRRAYDSILQAGMGVMTATGYRGDPPTKVGVSVIDNVASYVAATAVIGALYHREQTGRGQFVDISMQDCAAWLVGTLLPFDSERTPHQPADEPFPLSGIFEARDGWFAVAATDAASAAALRQLLDREANGDLTGSGAVLEAGMQAWAEDRTVEAAIKACSRRGVPAARVDTVGDVLRDPELEEVIAEIETGEGTVPIPVSPYAAAMDGQDRPQSAGPGVGEHSEAVLREVAGYDEETIAALAASGAIETGAD